jgi:hypothetical protein
MKTALFSLCFLIGLSAAAQDFVAPAPRPARTVRITPTRNVDGAAVRMARNRNPLQMINPLAPPEYGDGQDLVSTDPSDPFVNPQNRRARRQGITLFAFAW